MVDNNQLKIAPRNDVSRRQGCEHPRSDPYTLLAHIDVRDYSVPTKSARWLLQSSKLELIETRFDESSPNGVHYLK